MGWLIGCAAAAAALLLPVVLSVHLYLDVGRKKLYFGVYILRALKLFGGYASPGRGGVALHLSRRRAVLLPYRELFAAGKKFEIARGFAVADASFVLEAGCAAPYFMANFLIRKQATFFQSPRYMSKAFVFSRRVAQLTSIYMSPLMQLSSWLNIIPTSNYTTFRLDPRGRYSTMTSVDSRMLLMSCPSVEMTNPPCSA